MTRGKKLVLFIVCFLSTIFTFTTKVAASPEIERFGGSNRYETSISISRNNWEKSNYFILVSGENFPDALSAAPLSKKYNAPILLTENDSINSKMMDEINRLGSNTAFIIGGPGVISEKVEKQLIDAGIACNRIYGKDRYETSIKIAEIIGTNNGAFIASGDNFPDAVSAAAIASLRNMPILLTASKYLPEKVKNFIYNNNRNKYYIVGGQASVSENVINGINDYKRLGGRDRYETNLSIINEFISNINFNNTYLANANSYADALSGAASAGKTGSPIVLVSNSFNTKDSIIKSNIENISTISVLGGTGVISNVLVQKIINGGIIRVCLDPGHGGYDSGAVGSTGVMEKNITLAIALKTGKILKEKGIEIVYTRTSDSVSWPANVAQDLQKRCYIANNANVDYFVSIHTNSASASSANGAETYYYTYESGAGKSLAQSIQQSIINATGLTNRGIKTANFYVLKNTIAPAVLVETGFISNVNEEKLLNSNSFQDKMAQAIANGIMNFINKL
ncbi:N-acetylmuramoyl-L-alanine amidase [Clostridium tetanomorphum]|uniref:cell wall-binding repeat-containing protein n=1 Tax=Clostridium tetanomorphum TaxID=1553 RepID=UPI000452448E|nr:cell wall-binding repeat-containing protein [Clostridium tetanomorphum]KAJ51030.1 N-acetylmuramoyl-L-alanine amidase [Clostridium tetanomorphum DSM 665]MBP1865870.1 N-acetylmuramoyl-L-alanine amidase [Clostridium tetanomorphum]NRS85319.1 N-acetylmuramoyl-L-alanine amidase [Clostridium tetanomorphum]SQC02965.1 N-acetylmuramoyl-L-alanine amidase [Clostridium tetanomorphum]